ncbi:MAG: 50S ribosomal protein L1 [Patescibacteria group bacterium]|nr:50S ribosomal protein L1 [Patescibacteria group bacterium]MDD5490306.1 50S ribosomal protein L1 [Patescibacteria group bacterium]
MSRSKRYQEVKGQIDSKKTYSIEEALELVKKTSNVKFDASVELHIRLGIDPKKGEQQVRGSIALPHGTGKTQKIAAFVDGDKIKEAKEAGADIVADDEYIAELKKTEKIDFEIAIATPPMMKKLAAVAKILGPKGLMPSPKDGTVTADIGKTIGELKKGKVSFKNDDTGNVHLLVGKISFDTKNLIENCKTAMEAIQKAKPATSKGIYIRNAVLTSTMGPAIKLTV